MRVRWRVRESEISEDKRECRRKGERKPQKEGV